MSFGRLWGKMFGALGPFNPAFTQPSFGAAYLIASLALQVGEVPAVLDAQIIRRNFMSTTTAKQRLYG